MVTAHGYSPGAHLPRRCNSRCNSETALLELQKTSVSSHRFPRCFHGIRRLLDWLQGMVTGKVPADPWFSDWYARPGTQAGTHGKRHLMGWLAPWLAPIGTVDRVQWMRRASVTMRSTSTSTCPAAAQHDVVHGLAQCTTRSTMWHFKWHLVTGSTCPAAPAARPPPRQHRLHSPR